eukprot:GFUD01024650.1.p1 GENE.GFUD01024650.1~~GFUD01024650.1.p1  ORF type:complete len:962 (-),score=212.11 GFUD01024650.1:65-2950(-)
MYLEDMERAERINRLWKLVDERDDSQLNNEYFRPGGESYISTSAVKSCLQTITYLSYLEEVNHKYILLQGNQLINIKKPDGRTSLFWAVSASGNSCFQLKQNESFNIGEVKIGESWKKVCRRLLEYLVDQTEEERLQDGTPIINLILLGGKKFELQHNVRNLFGEFVVQIGQGRRSETHVQLFCPYSDETTIDVAIRCEAKTSDLINLKTCGGNPNLKTLNFWTKLENAKSSNLAPHIPDPVVNDDPYDSARFVHKAINKLLRNENDFIDEINDVFVPKWKVGNSPDQEAKITENIFIWVRKALEDLSTKNPGLEGIFKLSLSGSIAEGCRLKTKKGAVNPDSDQGIPELDEYEIDLVLEAHLDVRILLSDADLAGCWLHHSHHNLVQQELCTIENKNPFRHVGNVFLNKSYRGIGEKDELLKAQVFSDVIKTFVHKALINNTSSTVPIGFDEVEDIQTCIKTTRSGIILDLSYMGRKVSIDIVSLIPMGRTHLKEIVRIFPGFDQRKLQFLQSSNLISNRDGIIAKDENWRLSFSNSESRVLRNLDNVLYKSLKYLASVSGLNIKTYCIKELTLAYIVHCDMFKCRKESLMDSLLDLFVFSENNPISSPFYCSRLGSKSYKGCLDLFFKIILVHWTFGRIQPNPHILNTVRPARVRNSNSVGSITSLLLGRSPDYLSATELEEATCNLGMLSECEDENDLILTARSVSSLSAECASTASGTSMQQVPIEASSTSSLYSEPYSHSDYEIIYPDTLEAHQQESASIQNILSQFLDLSKNLTNAKISISVESQELTFNFSNETRSEGSTMHMSDSGFNTSQKGSNSIQIILSQLLALTNAKISICIESQELTFNFDNKNRSDVMRINASDAGIQNQMTRNFRSSIKINMNQEENLDAEDEEILDEGESDEEVFDERVSNEGVSDEEVTDMKQLDNAKDKEGFKRGLKTYHPRKNAKKRKHWNI